jgi:hypothetical protein
VKNEKRKVKNENGGSVIFRGLFSIDGAFVFDTVSSE